MYMLKNKSSLNAYVCWNSFVYTYESEYNQHQMNEKKIIIMNRTITTRNFFKFSKIVELNKFNLV